MFFLELVLPLFQRFLPLNTSYGCCEEKNIISIIKEFLDNHEMRFDDQVSLCATNIELESFMQEQIISRGLPARYMNSTIHPAASLIELAYHDCTLAEKKQAALYSWYMIYIDDHSPRDITAYIAFQERFLRHLPQLDPVLDALADVLLKMFDNYPVFFANAIINSTFDHITATCVEPAVEKLQLSASTSPRFPWFLRVRTGAGVAFSLFPFTNSLNVDYSACFEALADMDFWTATSNDLLSYYKESVAGETANYISNRAIVEARSQLEVLADLEHDLLQSRRRIYEILERNVGDDAVKVWRTWEQGYIIWHLQQKRYKLDEIGL